MAIAPDGTGTVVWERFDGATQIIQARTRPSGGSFGTAEDLSAPGQNAQLPQIAASPDGTMTAVWVRDNGANEIIQAATRPPGGSFGPPVNLSLPGRSAFNPQISTAPDGTTTVVWERSDGSDFIIQAATRLPGGSFGAPVSLSAPGQDADDPQLATAPDGTTTVVWRRDDGIFDRIQTATRTSGGSFGAPVNLSAPGGFGEDPQVATAPDRTTTAVWSYFDGSDFVIQAATRPPGGSFGAPVDVSVPGVAGQPQITAATDGTMTAIWYREDPVYEVIQTATRPAGGSFGTPVSLSATGQNAIDPQVTAAPDGTATAIWARSDGANRIVQSISTARPSPALGVKPTGTGTGQITSTPAGIDCGTDCAENYPSFTEVTLTATPDSGSTFTGWSGGGCSGTGTCEVTLVEATTVTAEFTDPTSSERLLQVNRKGNGGGTVTSTPAGINCGNDCAENYPASTEVTLTASPNSAATFNGWSGGGCSGTGNCVVTLEEATTVSADFGKPKLAALKISPKTRSAKPGKKAVIKVTVTNNGDGKTKNLKICASVPKKLLKKPSCRTPGNPGAGKSKTATFAVKVKNSAKKGKKPKVTFTATATGGFKKTGKATVKVK